MSPRRSPHLAAAGTTSPRPLAPLALLLLGLLIPASALALEFPTAPSATGAFSPNGDGEKDEVDIRVSVDGESVAVDSLFVGIYATAAQPPDPADLLSRPAEVSEDITDNLLMRDYIWFGRAGADGEGDPLLPDGFYYLQVWARAGADSLWFDPPRQISLNTAGPSFHSVALEPSPLFAPLAAGADTLLQVFFHSTDFDTLTDGASARILSLDPVDQTWEQTASLGWDRDYFELIGGLPRFRLLWDGRDDLGLYVDGLHRIIVKLDDAAGNPSVTAELSTDLEVLPPAMTVVDFNGPLESGALSFTVNPAALPDSVVVRVFDRSGITDCIGAADSLTVFDLVGTLLPESGFEEVFYSFLLPGNWGAVGDTLNPHFLFLDGKDSAGNTNRELDEAVVVSVRLDAEPPGQPIWETGAEEVLQRVILLSGTCETSDNESSIDVEVTVNGELFDTVSTDILDNFLVVADLENPGFFPGGGHTSEWTAVGIDAAGNRSSVSATRTIVYNPEPARVITARFRGLPGETIQINTPGDTRGIRIRVFGLDGELHRILDLDGGPRQFSADWNLKDAGGRDLLDGLYILNIETTLGSGEVEREREVVAIVRD